jgi:hypothetical protein
MELIKWLLVLEHSHTSNLRRRCGKVGQALCASLDRKASEGLRQPTGRFI